MDTDRAKTLLSVFTPLIFMLPDIFFLLLFFLFSSPLKYLNLRNEGNLKKVEERCPYGKNIKVLSKFMKIQ